MHREMLCEFDALFDAVTPEEQRGTLPSLRALITYRQAIARRTHTHLEALLAGIRPAAPSIMATERRGRCRQTSCAGRREGRHRSALPHRPSACLHTPCFFASAKERAEGLEKRAAIGDA
jgi:hypothetical protein